MSNTIDLSDFRPSSKREKYPEFQFQVNYTLEGVASENVTGFMTVMGGVYFIGTGTKPTETEPAEIDWLFSAPMDHVRSIISLGPAKTTNRMDA